MTLLAIYIENIDISLDSLILQILCSTVSKTINLKVLLIIVINEFNIEISAREKPVR